MPLLDRIDDRLGRMSGVMARAGLAFDERDGQTLELDMRGAVWRCLFCRRTDACTAWLAGGGPAGELPPFCPNAGVLARYRPSPPPARI